MRFAVQLVGFLTLAFHQLEKTLGVGFPSIKPKQETCRPLGRGARAGNSNRMVHGRRSRAYTDRRRERKARLIENVEDTTQPRAAHGRGRLSWRLSHRSYESCSVPSDRSDLGRSPRRWCPSTTSARFQSKRTGAIEPTRPGGPCSAISSNGPWRGPKARLARSSFGLCGRQSRPLQGSGRPVRSSFDV